MYEDCETQGCEMLSKDSVDPGWAKLKHFVKESKPPVSHRKIPPQTECGCLHGGVTENGRARNPLTLGSVPVLLHVQVWVHIPGDPQSVQLTEKRYNNSNNGGL